MNDPSQDVIIMVDTETLGLGPNAVVWQMAFVAVPKNAPDPVNAIRFDSFYLPVQPQIDAGRTIDAGTLAFWLKQPDETRLKLLDVLEGGDVDELRAYVRAFIRKVLDVINSTQGTVEVWARGPQFDIVKLESLFLMCGEKEPWAYDQVMDLRTMARQHGVKSDEIDSSDIVEHIALEDCRFQLRHYGEVMRRINERLPATDD